MRCRSRSKRCRQHRKPPPAGDRRRRSVPHRWSRSQGSTCRAVVRQIHQRLLRNLGRIRRWVHQGHGWHGPRITMVDPVNGVFPQTGVKGTPFGPVGWQPSIATNSATLGWRGSHAIPGFEDTKFVVQIEANVALTDSPGVTTSYTAQTAGVRGGIGSGTTYLGLSSPTWGSLKLGHGSTPYGNMSQAPGSLRRHGRRYGGNHRQYRRRQPSRVQHRRWITRSGTNRRNTARSASTCSSRPGRTAPLTAT